MTNVALVSDLHNEFWVRGPMFANQHWVTHLLDQPRGAYDILVLAGDIDATPNRLVAFLKDLTDRVPADVPIIYVDGNHEHYHRTHGAVHDKIRELDDHCPRFHFLNDESIVIDGTVIYGGCMWSDLMGNNPLVSFDAMRAITDFRLIANADGDVFHANDCIDLHNRFRANVPEQVDMFVTHFSPSMEGCDTEKWGHNNLNYYFHARCEDLILSRQPKLWLHGHTHDPVDYRVERTRVVANPRGYPNERFPCMENANILYQAKFVSL